MEVVPCLCFAYDQTIPAGTDVGSADITLGGKLEVVDDNGLCTSDVTTDPAN